MIYLLYGQDTFRSRKKVQEIEDKFTEVAGGSSGIFRVDAAEESLDEIAGALESGSLFDDRRLVIVKNALDADAPVQAFLEDRLGRFEVAKDVYIFWEALEELPGNEFAKALEEHAAKVQDFKKPAKAVVEKWLTETLQEKGAALTVLEREELLARAGGDLWKLQSELEKFILDSREHKMSGIVPTKPNIFALTDALGARNKHLALWLLYRFQEDGMEATRMFWTIAWHLKNLAIFRSLLDAGKDATYAIKATKQNPFVIKKGMEQARKFTSQELHRMYVNLLNLDLDSKRNKADVALGLERIILSL